MALMDRHIRQTEVSPMQVISRDNIFISNNHFILSICFEKIHFYCKSDTTHAVLSDPFLSNSVLSYIALMRHTSTNALITTPGRRVHGEHVPDDSLYNLLLL